MANAKKKGKRPIRRGADNAVEQLKALIPALEQFLDEEAQEPEHQDGEAVPTPAVEEGEGTHEDMGEVEADEHEEEGGSNELSDLIARAREVLQRLESHVSGEGTEGADENELEEAEGEDNEHGEDEHESEDENEESEDMSEIGADAEEGSEEHNGKASPGPKKERTAMGGDAALRRFYADSATKNRLYNRVSKVVGAFDHSRMDARGLALYGVGALKKRGHKFAVSKGQEVAALDSYLNGLEHGQKQARAAVQAIRNNTAVDSVNGGRHTTDEIDRFFNGE